MEFTDYQHAFTHQGMLPDKSVMSMSDALATPNASVWIPRVVESIVREEMEPLLIGANLLNRINWNGSNILEFPAFGALEASDIAEGQEYPEQTPNMGGASVTAKIGKSGLAIRLTEEMIERSQFDIIGLFLRLAGRALARWKEGKIWNMVRNMGATIFDNLTPASSMLGATSGRDMTGAQNGSVTMDDLFDAMARIMSNGFIPDTLIMHPLTWLMFVKDPVMRAFALQNGGGSFFQMWQGQVAHQAWNNPGMFGLTGRHSVPGDNVASLAATAPEDYHPQMNSAPQLPNYFNFGFRILVTPFVRFDHRRMLSDIYICDGSELGAIVVAEDVTTDRFTDPRTDMEKLKLKEKYGLVMFHAGEQIGVLKNVHVVPNEVVLPSQATLQVSGSTLTNVDRTTSPL
jgi:hypothetical protein